MCENNFLIENFTLNTTNNDFPVMKELMTLNSFKLIGKKYWRGFFNFSDESNWNFIYDDSIDENFKFFSTFNYVHPPEFENLFEGHFPLYH